MYSTGDVLHTVHALNSRKIDCILYIGNKERNKNPIYSGGIHAGGSESALCAGLFRALLLALYREWLVITANLSPAFMYQLLNLSV